MFSPDHWRHVHNRLAAGEEPRAYTADHHRAWLKRRSVDPDRPDVSNAELLLTGGRRHDPLRLCHGDAFLGRHLHGAEPRFGHAAPDLNASASIPVGLYHLHKIDTPTIGELVAVAPPEPIARYLAERDYLPRKVPLLKHVAAVSGQTICRTGAVITIDGKDVATALKRDRQGRDLPVWSGCHRLADGEVFILNADVPDSLDGRYFGVLPAETILGAVTPIWTRGDGPSDEQVIDHGH